MRLINAADGGSSLFENTERERLRELWLRFAGIRISERFLALNQGGRERNAGRREEKEKERFIISGKEIYAETYIENFLGVQVHRIRARERARILGRMTD